MPVTQTARAPQSGRPHRGLYPPIEPFHTDHLPVSELHSVYFEESGNPQGLPILVLHGGPGAGTEPQMRRFFDPALYRIILFDQRGCGRSRPRGCLIENHTDALISDIEMLRAHLQLDSWILFGGSWGVTLALAYAEGFPGRVNAMILRGVFLATSAEIEAFYQEPAGASSCFPDRRGAFLAPIPADERGDLIGAYYKRLTSDDTAVAARAAVAWCHWEDQASTLVPMKKRSTAKNELEVALAMARIECHYFIHKAFLDEGQLIRDIARVAAIPVHIVHGRYDAVCSVEVAWTLHRCWPGSTMTLVEGSGHSAFEPGTIDALVEATDKIARWKSG